MIPNPFRSLCAAPRRLLLLSPLLLVAACGGPSTEVGTVSIGFPLGKADVTGATYEITGDGLAQAMTGALTLNGDRAEGTVASVPTGSKTVVVKAFTGTAPNTTEVCTGTTTVTVAANATVSANLLLTCTDQLGDIAVSATFDATRSPDSASATVTGSGIAAPIVVPLAIGGGTLTGTIKGVPAGTNRSVTVSTTKNGTVECTGMSTGVTVAANATATVSLVGAQALTCTAPPPTTGSISINGQVNFTPRIHALSVSQPGVLAGGTVSAAVVASDGDGDTLTYSWTLGGSASALFSAATAATTNFTATNLAPGKYTLTATVSDGITPAVSGSVTLVVGSNLGIGWGEIRPNPTTTLTVGSGFLAYARLYVDNGGSPAAQGTAAAGEVVGVLAQGGYGPADGDPSSDPGAFTWSLATYEAACTGCGNNDEFKAEIKPLTAGTYRYGLRFSTNGGGTWSYVDLDSLSNGFQASQLPTVTVN